MWNTESRRAESGGGVLGRGNQPLPTRESVERYEIPQRGVEWIELQPPQWFAYILEIWRGC